VITGILLPLALAWTALQLHWLDAQSVAKLDYGFNRRAWEIAAIAAGAAGMLFLGILDDRKELKAGPKFVGQVLFATLVAVSGVRITLFVPSLAFSYFVTVFWILTVINAFNFMDNMNGLCSGLGLLAALFFGIDSAMSGQYLVASVSFLVTGALLGFLPYNFPKASVFLGDAGSHLVGYLLAVLAILPHFYTRENPRALAVFFPLLVLFVPLADLVWVVILRWRMGKPFYIGDTNHLSHRLVRGGLTRTQAVLAIWAIAAAVGALTLF
jgi:UDP-GlcNAc:undecaprenyl-phosphate GlcNAc-1-phosphate transferase